MRSFHATKEAGEESLCAALGMSVRQVEVCYFFIFIFITGWCVYVDMCSHSIFYLNFLVVSLLPFYYLAGHTELLL